MTVLCTPLLVTVTTLHHPILLPSLHPTHHQSPAEAIDLRDGGSTTRPPLSLLMRSFESSHRTSADERRCANEGTVPKKENELDNFRTIFINYLYMPLWF